ncbi:tRNA threonylcarbamoyladenosine biosynthesis protein TsaE [Candidatus Zixiibacteriota bacterium]|nr:tRNA threonylcarbamoyladenosine biosynthesis protein TsaE [candidate division Zixibacteria bacterium]
MMMTKGRTVEVVSRSPEETQKAGQGLAALLKERDLVVLSGPLGAGKTCFIKGMALGLGVAEDDVKSPSFTLVNEYHGDKWLYHFDLYRLKDESELYQIGWDEYLLMEGIVVVEWGERAAGYLPNKRIEIEIAIIDNHTRKIEITYIG